MIKKVIAWLKQPFYSLESPEKVDWNFLAVIVVVAFTLLAFLYAILIEVT